MTVFCLVKFMDLKLNETSVICGSSELLGTNFMRLA